jgi:hypothetical protein
MSEHRGSCDCGRIRLILREEPSEAAECNCSICRRTAGLWHYSPPTAVTVQGEGVAYQRGDRAINLWHCPDCGCTTHWTPTAPDYPRMAVNLRMFDPALWCDLPRRLIDGASY